MHPDELKTLEVVPTTAPTTLQPIFGADEKDELASHLDMFVPDQAYQIVDLIAEMMRQVECRRKNLPIK